MKKSSLIYVIKLLFFIMLAAFVLDKLVFTGLSLLNEQVFTGQSGGKVNQFLKEKDDLDFIVFGSSRANHHINNEIIVKNSFNMGLDGTKIAFSSTLIKTLPKNKKQTILLHISPQLAFKKDYKGEDIASLSKYYHVNDIIKSEMNQLGQNNLLNNFFWCLNFHGAVLGLVKNYFLPAYDYKTYSGYDPLVVTIEQGKKIEQILRKKSKQNCEDVLTLNPIYNKMITELKEFSLANNKSIILFTSPIYQDDCKNDDNALEEILKKEGITYWNYTDFFIQDSSLRNWKDNSHLSNIGAEKFSAAIQNRMSNLINN